MPSMETYLLCLPFSCFGQKAGCVPDSWVFFSPAFFQYFIPLSYLFFDVLFSSLSPITSRLSSFARSLDGVLGSLEYAAKPEFVAKPLVVGLFRLKRGKQRPGSQMSLAQHVLPSSGLINSGTGYHTGSLGDPEILWPWAPSWRNRIGNRSRALVHQPGARTAVAQTLG
ncbi:hypothetical protein F4823DRAFT_39773 [Ustulina deusta]|nr:hypothetical protein F4823DRAFT_39773 [Ustulina deusta]